MKSLVIGIKATTPIGLSVTAVECRKYVSSPDEEQDQNRLTVGQRIGGAIKQPSYMAKTSQGNDAL